MERGMWPTKKLSCVFRFHNFTAVVIAAGFADVVGPFLFAAIRAFLVGGGRQGIMCAPHIASGCGNFFLRDCHL
jgi:hypothetical protein